MAKRNYGTLEKKTADLIDDLLSKDAHGLYHNGANFDTVLVPLFEACLKRTAGWRMAEILWRFLKVQTVGSSQEIEDKLEMDGLRNTLFKVFCKGEKIYGEKGNADEPADTKI